MLPFFIGLPAWTNDIHDIRADCSKLREATGFAPATSLEQGLRQTYEWFLRRARGALRSFKAAVA